MSNLALTPLVCRFMRKRWFVIDHRYFSVRFAIDFPDPERPNHIRVFSCDISTRPISPIPCASTWTAVGRCANIALLIPSFGTFSFRPDHFDSYDEQFRPDRNIAY